MPVTWICLLETCFLWVPHLKLLCIFQPWVTWDSITCDSLTWIFFLIYLRLELLEIQLPMIHWPETSWYIWDLSQLRFNYLWSTDLRFELLTSCIDLPLLTLQVLVPWKTSFWTPTFASKFPVMKWFHLCKCSGFWDYLWVIHALKKGSWVTWVKFVLMLEQKGVTITLSHFMAFGHGMAQQLTTIWLIVDFQSSFQHWLKVFHMDALNLHCI